MAYRTQAGPPAGQRPALHWVISFPLLTSRFVLWDLLKVLVWTGILFYAAMGVAILFAGSRRSFPWGDFALALGWGLAGLGFVFAVAMLAVFGNRYMVRFLVDREGVGYESLSKRARTVNRAAIILGALAGSPGAMGAGLLASSQETGYFP